MNYTQRRERYRAALTGNEVVYTASVFDPISAQIAEDVGFTLGNLSGTLAGAEVLGTRAQSVLTMTELAEQVRRICRASTLSIHVDAENGGGDAVNVMRAVQELENAGASAIVMEDGQFPIPYGFFKEKKLAPGQRFHGPMVSLEEAVAKIKSAVAARGDSSTVIGMRTNSLFNFGVDEAVRRARAYEQAGVDAVSMVNPTREAVEALCSETRLPLIIAPSESLRDKAWLSAHRVRVALDSRYAFEAAIKSMHEVYKALRDGVPLAELRSLTASPELYTQATREAPYLEWNKKYWS